MIVGFWRKNSSPLSPLLIYRRTVEIVHHFKFLGSAISNNLKWELDRDTFVIKAKQRLYFLRRLGSFGLTTQIMFTFYRAVIEIVLTFLITVWFGSITVKENLRLNSCKTCFQNNRQKPPQSCIIVSAAPVKQSHSHLS